MIISLEGVLSADLPALVGTCAAILTTASYFPQVRKTWITGETGDLSLKMLVILACGLGLWTVYGLLRGDVVIVIANALSLGLLCVLLYVKVFGR